MAISNSATPSRAAAFEFGLACALLGSVALCGCSSEDAGDAPADGQAGNPPSTAGASGAGGGAGGAQAGGSANVAGGGAGGSNASGAGGSNAGGAGSNAGGASGSNTGGAGGSSMAGASGGGGGPSQGSEGCKKMPSLENSTSNSNPTAITLSVGGMNREYAIRWPSNYDNNHPYRLILDLHGYGGSYRETSGNDYFGLWTASENTTIFVSLSAIDKDWSKGDNVAYVEAVLEAVEADLCIDPSRIMLEGFSQGAAEVWQLACALPGVFRAAVGHSGGGVAPPSDCDPIPYLGSGGLGESVTQTSQTDKFAQWNGCMVSTLPTAPTGGHACTNYMGCPTTAPVRWCNFDGKHTPLPTDAGMNSSWMPSETWPFFSQF